MESLPRKGWNMSRRPRYRYINLDPATDTHRFPPCHLSTFFGGVSLAVLALVSISVFGPQRHPPQEVAEALLANAAPPQSAAAAAAAASIRVWNSYLVDEGYDQLYPWSQVGEPYKTSVLTIDAADQNGFEATVR